MPAVRAVEIIAAISAHAARTRRGVVPNVKVPAAVPRGPAHPEAAGVVRAAAAIISMRVPSPRR